MADENAIERIPGAIQDYSDELLLRWMRFQRGDIARDTEVTYAACARRFIRWCEQHGIRPGDADEQIIMAYRNELLQKHSPATVNFHLVVVRRLFEAAEWMGLRRGNPAKAVKVHGAHRRSDTIRYTDLDGLKRIIEAAAHGPCPLRDTIMVSLMGLQGMRMVELARLKRTDFQVRGNRKVVIAEGKGSVRVVFLREDVAALIELYLSTREDECPAMFVYERPPGRAKPLGRDGIARAISRAIKAAAVPITPHGLRHTAATLLLASGAPLEAIQDLLGHADPATTRIYARLTRQADLAAAERIPLDLGTLSCR